MNALIRKIDEHCSLSEAEKTLLSQTLRTLHFPKGSVVIGEGKVDDSLYFLQDGVWRANMGRDGEDITLWFAIPGESVFSTWGHRGLPARFSITSSCDSIAIEMKRDTIRKLSQSSPAFVGWLNELYVDLLLTTDESLVNIANPKAEKRYLAFMKKMPELFNRVPLKEIAGFIGVTPQSLSRIRAGLRTVNSEQ